MSDVYLLKNLYRFLLVSLKIEVILGEVTIGQRRKKLEEMTRGNGLSDAYTTTLMRLKRQKGNKSVLGLKVLMWVLYSERPLLAEELCHALGVEIQSAALDQNNVPAIRTLLASCLGLVAIEASSSRVRLVHFTLQEHLLSNPTLFDSLHTTIAEVCLTYLNFVCVRDLSPTLKSAPPTMPFLEYASVHWGNHTIMGMTENVKILALRLHHRLDEHISAQLLLLSYEKTASMYRIRENGPKGFTALHGVAFLGIVDLVPAVLEMKEWDISVADCAGLTALTWAALRGNEGVVKILLEQEGVNPNLPCSLEGRGPLGWAASNGHEEVVKMLFERGDVNFDQPDTMYHKRPLLLAAENGHQGLVKLFLEQANANPDREITRDYGELLSSATYRGHAGVVKMLLERVDANPDQPIAYDCERLLSSAAGGGNEVIVKMLLERADANPNQPDGFGHMPLTWEAWSGHEGVVHMLLEREDVNPDQPDASFGATPLSLAATNRREGIVKRLLERKEVNPNYASPRYDQIPLVLAARYGHTGIVKMLLERQDVCATVSDSYNQTSLSLALSEGHDDVVRILRDHANSHTTDRSGHASPVPPARHGGGRAGNMEPRIYDSNTSTIDLNTRAPSAPADPDEREAVSDPENPRLRPPDSDLSPNRPNCGRSAPPASNVLMPSEEN